jgi:copper(I)-binding protein
VILSNRAAQLRVLAVAAAAALAPAIAGCEAGFNAPTQQWHQPAAGTSAVVNDELRINNVFVLGAAPAFSLPRGGSAGLFLAINNEGAPDRLVGVTAPGTAAAVQLPAGGVRLPTEQSVHLSGPAPRVILRGLTRSLGGGQHILVVLQFLRAGNVALAVPVMPRAQWFSTFSPAPLLVSPSPSPTGTASPSPGATSPSPGATSPSPSPSATG